MDGIVTGFGTTIGTLSENTVPYTAEPTREFAREIEIDRHVSGWGFDLKWMSKIFFQRDVDVSGFYSASGISLDFVFLKSSFDATAEQREYHIIPDDDDLDVRFDIFLDLGIGYQIDLGMSNIGIGLRAGLPFMGFLAYRGSFDVNDTDRGIGMPFYWGPRIGFYM